MAIVVLWRLPWFVLAWILKLLLVSVVLCGWGRLAAEDVWRDLE